MRQKKQEKKRQRRLGKDGAPVDSSTEETPADTGEASEEEIDKPMVIEEKEQ